MTNCDNALNVVNKLFNFNPIFAEMSVNSSVLELVVASPILLVEILLLLLESAVGNDSKLRLARNSCKGDGKNGKCDSVGRGKWRKISMLRIKCCCGTGLAVDWLNLLPWPVDSCDDDDDDVDDDGDDNVMTAVWNGRDSCFKNGTIVVLFVVENKNGNVCVEMMVWGAVC